MTGCGVVTVFFLFGFLAGGVFVSFLAVMRGRGNKEFVDRQERYHLDVMVMWKRKLRLETATNKLLERIAKALDTK